MELFERWESEIRGYSRAYPTVFTKASNARQLDEQGRSYIDFFAGAGVLNFGHNNPRMKAALIRFIEADGVAHSLDMATDVKREFIRAFVDTILKPRDWDYKLQFMGPTGTNAVEAALKLARRVTGRSHVIAFSQGFHGMTLGSLACTANQYFRNAAGVPLIDGLESAAGASGNYVYRKALLNVRTEVMAGMQMNVAMRTTKLFPDMLIQMVMIGEESGSLDNMLNKIANIYEMQVDDAVDGLSSLIEPIMMVVIGTLVGGLIVGMYLPIFQMGNVVG